jgi:putative ABC transport system ATP-binding protein
MTEKPVPATADADIEEAEDLTAEESELLAATHIVRAVGVRKTYMLGGVPLHALDGVDFSVRRGEYVSIMGPSGSGKTTLFNMIGGLDKPNEGRVFIDEVNIAALDNFELAWLRCHKIGYIFQTFNLIRVTSALDNVMLPMLFAGLPQADAQDKAAELLRKVGLGDRLLHKPVQMSGGQQQRVAIARSLANDPAILLADEPTGNLDVNTGRDIIDLLRELNQAEGVTVITATHDHKMLVVSDRIAWIRDGKLVRMQKREEIKIQEETMAVRRGEQPKPPKTAAKHTTKKKTTAKTSKKAKKPKAGQ